MNLLSKTLSCLVITGVMTSAVTPAFAAEKEPEKYIQVSSTFLPKEVDNAEYNKNGQVTNASQSFATPDVFALRLGDNVALDVIKNDTLIKGEKIDVKSLQLFNDKTGDYAKSLDVPELGSFSVIAGKGTDTIKPVTPFDNSSPAEDYPLIAFTQTGEKINGAKVYYKVDVTNADGEFIREIQNYFIVGTAEKVSDYCDNGDGKKDMISSPWSGEAYGDLFNPENYSDNINTSSFCVAIGANDSIKVTAGESVSIDVTANDLPKYNFNGEPAATQGYTVSKDKLFIKNTDGDNAYGIEVPGKGLAYIDNGKFTFDAYDGVEGKVDVTLSDVIVADKDDKEFSIGNTVVSVLVEPKPEPKPEPVVEPKPEPVKEEVKVAPEPVVEEKPEPSPAPVKEEDKIVAHQGVAASVAPVTKANTSPQTVNSGASKALVPPSEEPTPEPEPLVPVTPITPEIPIDNPSTIDEEEPVEEEETVEIAPAPVREEEPTPEPVEDEQETPAIIKEGGEDINYLALLGFAIMAGWASLASMRFVKAKKA